VDADPLLSLAQVVPDTQAEGPGRRFAVWFQGCPLRCPGCCNPEFLPFATGTPSRLSDLLTQLDATTGLNGVSLLGGEPFAHAAGAARLAEAARDRGLGVMVYSGYTLEQIRELPLPAGELLSATDLLVDGPYLRDQPEAERRWVGSRNQRVHFLTDRYDPADGCWRRRNTLEVRVRGAEVSVNGFPAAGAAGLWKPTWARTRR
jgi:anaerobic ribonucleoside-triphosphate reductase activating protein